MEKRGRAVLAVALVAPLLSVGCARKAADPSMGGGDHWAESSVVYPGYPAQPGGSPGYRVYWQAPPVPDSSYRVYWHDGSAAYPGYGAARDVAPGYRYQREYGQPPAPRPYSLYGATRLDWSYQSVPPVVPSYPGYGTSVRDGYRSPPTRPYAPGYATGWSDSAYGGSRYGHGYEGSYRSHIDRRRQSFDVSLGSESPNVRRGGYAAGRSQDHLRYLLGSNRQPWRTPLASQRESSFSPPPPRAGSGMVASESRIAAVEPRRTHEERASLPPARDRAMFGVGERTNTLRSGAPRTGASRRSEPAPAEVGVALSDRVLRRTSQASFHLMTVDQPGSIHVHEVTQLTLFVLSGLATVHVGDAEFRVGAGDTVEVPAGQPHWVENLGSEASRLYAIYSPPYDGTDSHAYRP